MELKNSAIWGITEALTELAQVKLPVKISFHVAQLASKFRDPYQIIFQQRQGLFQEIGRASCRERV